MLYGNKDTNAAWSTLFRDDAQITLGNGVLKIGERSLDGAGMGCLYVSPRRDMPNQSYLVAVVGGTDVKGMRLCDRLPYFVSGVAYPDLTVFNADVLTEGLRGVQVAGYFGNDWSVENGDFAWRKAGSAD